MTPRPHPLWHHLGGLALCAGALGWLALAGRVGAHMPLALGSALALLLSLIGGWALADLVSGLFHYWADELANERTPWLGRNIIVPFREHHTDPLAMLQHGVSETNGDNALAALPLLGALWLWGPAAPQSVPQLLLSGAVLGFAGGVLLTNQIHQWAHARHAPRVVRWLQRRSVLLSPIHHAQHHRAHDRAYCITSGWANTLLDRILPPRSHS